MVRDDSGWATCSEAAVDPLWAVLDTLSDAVVVVNPTGRITDANPAARSRYGHDELVGRTLDGLAAGRSTDDPLVDRLRRAAGGDERTVGWTVRTADGDLLEETLHPTVTTVDGEPRVVVVARDPESVDGRARSERLGGGTDHHLPAAYLRKAQDVADVGWWFKEIPSDRIHWSEKVFEMWRVDTDAATIDHETFLSYIHPDDADRVDAAWAAAETGDPYDIEHRIVTDDGETRWMRQQAELGFEDGDPVSATGVVQDITDQKRREAELTRLRTQFERFAGTVRDAFFLVSADYSETLYVNDAVERIYGITPAEAYADPESWLRHVHPDDTEALSGAVEEFREGVITGTVAQEYRIQHPERGLRWVQAQIDVVTDDDGVVTQVAGITTDITGRKEREEELRRSRDLIEQTQENASIGWWEADLVDDTLHWSDEVYRIHDRPVDQEVTLADGIEFYHPEDRPTIQEAFDRLRTEGEPYELELRIVTAGDRTRWVRTVADPQVDTDGEVVGALGIFQDITDRKRDEQELEQARTELRQIIDLIPDPVFVKNRAGTFLLANDALADCYGETTATVEGQQESAVMPDASEYENFREDDLAVIDSGEPKQIPEESVTTADGETRIFSTVKIPYETAHSSEPAVLAYARDVTDLKTYERQLETQRDNLDVLNQVVRHDIRNDLQLISAYVEMLDGTLGVESQSYLDVITRSTDNAIELTTTARDLAQTMLQADANRRPVPLARTLDGQIDRLLSAESTTVVTVTGELPRVHVLADDLLEAVFRNLLKNAVQHNDTEEPEIGIETAVDDDAVTVRIADNGPGVSDAHKTQIFGRGEQGLDSNGTGIGLYLVDTLVDRYGGTVVVEDNEPRGAVFSVELPLAD
ncbi:PAS domain-containing protein [Halohasta salina]|uniref:PAS domain-containing protein n=1 Tax=Halohasta salina TaxID=2961621 RepID=UPI0020A258C5|nr:PAS domain S-box protein [Halohasta salina]